MLLGYNTIHGRGADQSKKKTASQQLILLHHDLAIGSSAVAIRVLR